MNINIIINIYIYIYNIYIYIYISALIYGYGAWEALGVGRELQGGLGPLGTRSMLVALCSLPVARRFQFAGGCPKLSGTDFSPISENFGSFFGGSGYILGPIWAIFTVLFLDRIFG